MWIRLVKKERKSGIATSLQDFVRINQILVCSENLQYLKDF